MSAGRVAASLLLALLAAAPATAGAEPAAAPPSVPIVIAGADEAVTALERMLLDLLRFTPVSPAVMRRALIEPREVVTPVPVTPASVATLARVWIDLTGPAQCLVYIADSSWERVLVRRVVLAGPVDEVTREEICQIVSSSLEALLAGEAVGVTRPEAAAMLGVEPEPVRVPVELPPPVVPVGPGRVGVELALGYELAAWSAAQPPPQGLAASVGLVLRRTGLRPAFGLSLSVRPATEVAAVEVGARVDEVPVALWAALEPLRRGRVSLRVFVAVGACVTHVDPSLRPGGAGLALQEGRLLVGADLRGGLELRVRLAGSLALGLGLAAEAVLPIPRLLIERPAGDELVFEPWPARPLLSLSLSGEPL